MQHYVSSKIRSSEDINKSSHVEVDRVNYSDCHRIKDTRLDQQPLVSMTGTPKNELNKIRMDIVKRDNINEVAQDGVESTASQLQGGRLVGEVDEAARTCYERVKGMIVYLLYLLYSASVVMKRVLSCPSNQEIYERVETNETNEANESNELSSSGENKSEEEETSASVDIESVVSNPSNKENYERDKTNESNKFSSSGENMSEEERPSKGQEGSEIKTNSRGSHDKTKSGEYILSRPPKKPGGKEAVEFDTITTMSCGTTLTFENSNSTITNDLEYWKEPTIVKNENVGTGTSTDREKNEENGDMGVIKEDLPFEGFDFMGDEIDTLPQQIWFTTRKEIRNIEARKGHDIYMDGYQDYVLRKRRIAKVARKWKAPTNKPKEFKFSVNLDQSKPPEGVFMFGSAARKVPSQKFKVETKKAQGTDHMSNTTKKRRGSILIPRKINPYELRVQELKIEEDKRAKRKFLNWKRRQQQQLDKNTEVLDVSEFLRRKVPKGTRKKRRINTREQKTNKVVQKDIETTYISEGEDFCILCLEKRQQSSSAVMFARLRSNRRYKPGD